MFNNLKELNSGKIKVKVLATLLVITLTFTNFALLGTQIFESIATDIKLDEQNTDTNSDSVNLDAYLEESDTSEITDEKIVLEQQIITNKIYVTNEIEQKEEVEVEVEEELEEAEVVVEEAEQTEQTELESEEIEVETEEESEVEAQAEEELEENKDKPNKRIVQLLVRANLKNNIVPVESTKIEVKVPNVGAVPNKVKVAAYNTLATNGKTSIEFGDLQTSKWEYSEETGIATIEVFNKPDKNNIISWKKDCKDEFIITYVYDENVNIESFTSVVDCTMKIYGKTEKVLEQRSEQLFEKIGEVENLVGFQISKAEEIYKGNMYAMEETDYQTNYSLFVSYADLSKKILIQDVNNSLNSEDGYTYYKNTKIDKAQAKNLLGEEGTIKIYNANNMDKPLVEILLSDVTEENIVFNYTEEVNNIVIEMSEAVKEGSLEIINEKAIKVEEIDASEKEEKIKEITQISTSVKLTVEELENNKITEITREQTNQLLEPVTTIKTAIDKTSISNQVENNLRMLVLLETINTNNKLFKNPTINIELPKEITEVELANEISLLYEEELKIKSSDIKTNENGNKVIIIELEGIQTKQNKNSAQSGANIVLDLKLKSEQFITNRNVEIKTTCINDGEKIESKNNIEILSREGLVTKNSILVKEELVEKVNSNTLETEVSNKDDVEISSKIINNNGKQIQNLNIIAKLPKGILLKEAITVNLENAKVSYSETENYTNQSFVNSINDFSKVKAIKIQIPTMEQAEVLDLKYNVTVEENIKEEEVLNSILNINYYVGEQLKKDEIKYTLNKNSSDVISTEKTEDIAINIEQKTQVQSLYEGQIVTYKVNVENIGEKELSNLKLKYLIPEGAVYTEFVESQATDIIYADDESLTAKEWNIESFKPREKKSVEITIKIKNGAKKIINKAQIVNEQNEVIAELISDPMVVKKGDVSVLLSRRDNSKTILREGNSIKYIVIVKNNTNTSINNVVVSTKVPEQTLWVENSEHNNNWKYDSKTKQLEYTINTLNAGESKELWFEVKVDKLNNNSADASIDNTAVVILQNGDKFESNIQTSKVVMPRWQITMEANHPKKLKEGDSVKYVIKVKNIGQVGAAVTILDELPSEIQFRKLTYYLEGEDSEEETTITKAVKLTQVVEEGKTLTIEIEGVTYELPDNVASKEITNVAKIELGNGEYLESEKNVSIITNDVIPQDPQDPENPEDPQDPEKPEDPEKPQDPQDPEDPEDPKDPQDPEKPEDPEDPKDPEKPQDPEKTYSISGLAWLDENQNGTRQDNEKIMQLVEVMLLDKKGNIVLDSNGKEITTKTSLLGTYKFSDLPVGEYMVAFAYNAKKYSVTKYQVKEADAKTNSDVISKTIIINNKERLVAITDTIELKNKNISNIDIGLIENAEFDLKLEKFVSKIIVTNNKGTTTYNYENADFTKVEIHAKQVDSSVVLIEYEIRITNEGSIDGYVTDVIDYLPKELTFNSETNPDWYMTTDGALHNISLTQEPIEVGKSQSVKLVLTKTLKSDNLGTIENIAEIGASTNIQETDDKDSVAANKKDGEDDIAKANVIIAVKTGGAVLYISIVLGSLLILGLGLYIINKKVLRGGKSNAI